VLTLAIRDQRPHAAHAHEHDRDPGSDFLMLLEAKGLSRRA
jgi:hypothetical protein